MLNKTPSHRDSFPTFHFIDSELIGTPNDGTTQNRHSHTFPLLDSLGVSARGVQSPKGVPIKSQGLVTVSLRGTISPTEFTCIKRQGCKDLLGPPMVRFCWAIHGAVLSYGYIKIGNMRINKYENEDNP